VKIFFLSGSDHHSSDPNCPAHIDNPARAGQLDKRMQFLLLQQALGNLFNERPSHSSRVSRHSCRKEGFKLFSMPQSVPSQIAGRKIIQIMKKTPLIMGCPFHPSGIKHG
jgi:hypothetical protein